MADSIRVLILGTGRMGSEMARCVLDTPGLELTGAYGKRRERAGDDLGRVTGLGRDLGVSIDVDLRNAVARTRPDVALQATCSSLDDAWPEIAVLLREGVSIVSIAEEMAYPACRSPAVSPMQMIAVRPAR